MDSRQRVIDTICHRRPDRMPLYAWVRANLADEITEQFGSVEAFEDHYRFDLAHLSGRVWMYTREAIAEATDPDTGAVTPERLAKVEMHGPDDPDIYEPIRQGVEHHKNQRGRFVYCQTPGIFEHCNGPFGIENHLMYLAMCPDALRRVYERHVEWSIGYANRCLDLGVDMVHVSDDWGAQVGPMFSPTMWRALIYPYHKRIAEAVKARGAFLSLHSDGNIMPLVDGVCELGYDVVHPWQESAGMPLETFRDNYRDRLTVLGGLDVQATLGFGRIDEVRAEIDRVVDMFSDGGLMLCTTHFVQAHCSMDELTAAMDYARERIDRT